MWELILHKGFQLSTHMPYGNVATEALFGKASAAASRPSVEDARTPFRPYASADAVTWNGPISRLLEDTPEVGLRAPHLARDACYSLLPGAERTGNVSMPSSWRNSASRYMSPDICKCQKQGSQCRPGVLSSNRVVRSGDVPTRTLCCCVRATFHHPQTPPTFSVLRVPRTSHLPLFSISIFEMPRTLKEHPWCSALHESRKSPFVLGLAFETCLP